MSDLIERLNKGPAVGDLELEVERLQASVDDLTELVAYDESWKKNQYAKLQERIERLEGAMQEFVDRRDSGSVHSNYTYAKFKELLALDDTADDKE